MYSQPDTGQRVCGPAPFQTRGDATRWLVKVESELHRGELIDPNGGKVAFGKYSDDWLAERVHLRPKTTELYEYLLRVHISPTFGTVPLNKISSASIRKWNSHLRAGSLSNTTAAKAYRLLRQILQNAVDDGLIKENPCRIKGAATERTKEREIPSLDDVTRIAEAIDRPYRTMVLVAAIAGLRKGECFGLARRHLDLDSDPSILIVERARLETLQRGMIFQEPKTAAGHRRLALPPVLVEELRAHLDQFVAADAGSLLFVDVSTNDTPSKTAWRTTWDRARRHSGIDCTFHDLRHVAGTLNAAAGATIKEAMARLGHASPEAALRYQHASLSRDAQIATDVDRLLRQEE